MAFCSLALVRCISDCVTCMTKERPYVVQALSGPPFRRRHGQVVNKLVNLCAQSGTCHFAYHVNYNKRQKRRCWVHVQESWPEVLRIVNVHSFVIGIEAALHLRCVDDVDIQLFVSVPIIENPAILGVSGRREILRVTARSDTQYIRTDPNLMRRR